MKKKGRIILLLIILIIAAGAAIWFFWFRGSKAAVGDELAFVDSVASITGVGANGVNNRFSGVVEPQRTEKVEVASGMKVKDTFVSVGQEVEVGTELFSYDTDEAQDSITQLEIDIENYDITIESTQAQIKQYEKERDKVSDDEKMAYTTQIMTLENSIKRAEYEKKSKQAELESLKRQIANAVVTSTLKGVVKTINKNNSGNSDDTNASSGMDDGSDDSSNAYMTIMATGDYRIKGTINEQNISDIQQGANVIVHSRVDESITWNGVITSIDMENASTSQSNSYSYGNDNSMSTSSTYPFYVELEDSTGLMLGQHVYVENDNGQTEERTGLWLPEYYLLTDENGEVTPYVWAASDNDRLEMRGLTLGEYDEELMEYEILDGLDTSDYIALPMDGLQEGQGVTRNVDQMDSSDDEWLDDSDGVVYDDSMDEGMLFDDQGSLEVFDESVPME